MDPLAVGLAAAIALRAGAAPAPPRLQLQVVHDFAIEARDIPVTSGIPWPRGLLRSPQRLRLLDERGKELPLQVEVLSRWPDGSVQWTLLDFQTSVPRQGMKWLWLDHGGPPRRARHPTPVVVDEGAASITVSTGAAIFEVGKRAFHLLERVRLADSRAPLLLAHPDDGIVAEASEEKATVVSSGKTAFVELEPSERVFLGRGPLGPQWFRKRGFRVLSATTGKELPTRVVGASFDAAGERSAVGTGWCNGVFLRLDSSPGEVAEIVYPRAAVEPKRYSSARGPVELAIETKGPLRTVIRAKGTLAAPDDSTLLDYVARMHFFAGKAAVGLSLTLVNRQPMPLSVGRDAFPLLLDDVTLRLGLRLRGAIRWALGAEVGHTTSHRGSFERSSQSAALVQFPAPAMRLARYAVIQDGRETASGGAAAGGAGLWAENGGLVLSLRRMAAHNPKALRLSGSGRIEVGLFPREAGPCEEFFAGRARTCDLVLVFFSRTPPFLPEVTATVDGVVVARALPPDTPVYDGRWPASSGVVDLAALGDSDYDLLFPGDLANLLAGREATGSYGTWRYGDFGTAEMRTVEFSVARATGAEIESPDLLDQPNLAGMTLAFTSGPLAGQSLRERPVVVGSDPRKGSLTLAEPLRPRPPRGARAVLYRTAGAFLSHRFDPGFALAREYLRRGEPSLLAEAWAVARHMADVCTFHGGGGLSERWLGACHDPDLGPTDWLSPGLSTRANWYAGVWLTYLLTGDRLLLDAAMANARFALRHADDPDLDPQAAALALVNLGFAADVARAASPKDAALLETAQKVFAGRLLDFQRRAGHGAHADSAIAASLALSALLAYYHRVPEEALRGSILAAARSLASPKGFWAGHEAGFPADGLLARWGCPDRQNLFGPPCGVAAASLAAAAALANDPALLVKARRLERVAALLPTTRPGDFALRYRAGDLFARPWLQYLKVHHPQTDERVGFLCRLESAADVALPELGTGGSVLHRPFVKLPDGTLAFHAEFPGATGSPEAGLWVPLLDSPNALPHQGAIEFRILYRKPPTSEHCWLVTGAPRSHGTSLTLLSTGLELASTYKRKWHLRILARDLRVRPGTWHHVAFAWNRVAGTTLFFDGKPVANSPNGRLGLSRRLRIPAAPRDPRGDYLVRDLRIWRQPPERFQAAFDTTPPARVTDLLLAPAEGRKLLLSWTAPGDDGTTGRAARYDIRMSTLPFSPVSSRWAEAVRLQAPEPKEAGQLEKLTIAPLPADRRLYLALRAEDDAGNPSPLSNVVATDVNHPPTPDAGPPVRHVLAGCEVLFDATGSSDPDGDPLTFTWSGGAKGPVLRRRFEEPGRYSIELTASDARTTASTTVTVIAAEELKVNFQPRLARASAPGFVQDGGLAYSRARGYGWLAMPGNPRAFDRPHPPGISLAARSGLAVPAGSVWAADLPNGTYQLTIALGDPARLHAPHLEVILEGRKVAECLPGQKAPVVIERIKTTVADGQLNLEVTPAHRGDRAEINYLIIRRPAP